MPAEEKKNRKFCSRVIEENQSNKQTQEKTYLEKSLTSSVRKLTKLPFDDNLSLYGTVYYYIEKKKHIKR